MVTNVTIAKKKKEHKQEAKADEKLKEELVEEAPISLLTHVNNIFYSIFSNVNKSKVNINKQQTYNSNGLYAHKPYIFNNFTGAISEYKVVLHCEGYGYGEFPVQIMTTFAWILFNKDNENV